MFRNLSFSLKKLVFTSMPNFVVGTFSGAKFIDINTDHRETVWKKYFSHKILKINLKIMSTFAGQKDALVEGAFSHSILSPGSHQ